MLRLGTSGNRLADRLLGNHAALRTRAAYGAAAIGVVLGLAVYLSTFKDIYIDDAYIQLQYARTLVTHNTWGFFPDRPANTATSPLSVMVTALFGLFFRSIVDAVTWLTAVELSLLLLSLLFISRRLFGNYYFGLLAFTAFATNPLLLSTIGLDSILYTLLVVASVAVFLSRTWWILGVVLGLLTLTRPEGILLFGIYAVLLPVSIAKAELALAYVWTILPWYFYSWRYLGSVVPDTLLIKKTSQAAWGRTYSSGLQMYWERYPHATFVAFFLLPFALFAVWWWWLRPCNRNLRFVVAIVGTYGLVHFVAYSLLEVPPYHWYYTHQMIPTVLIGSLGIAYFLQNCSLLKGRITGAAAYLTALAPIIGLLHLAHLNGFPFREPPIHTQWSTHARRGEVALWLKDNLDPAAVIDTNVEIGTIAFYSERYLHNEFSDMNIPTAWMVMDHYRERPRTGWIFRANFYWRREQPPLPPASYFLEGVPFDDGVTEGGDIVKSWATSTTWMPRGRIYLRRLTGGTVPQPRAVGQAHQGGPPHGGLADRGRDDGRRAP